MRRDGALIESIIADTGQRSVPRGGAFGRGAFRHGAFRHGAFYHSVLPPLLLVLAVLVVWQLAVALAQPSPQVVPSPFDVAAALGKAWSTGQVQQAVGTSLGRGLVGFLIAVVVGTPIGMLLAEVGPLRRAAGPLIAGLQLLPSIAWVPAAILWFGLTDATIYFVVLLGSVPAIINGLLDGVDQLPAQFRRVGTVLGANRFQQSLLVVLPGALPGYLGGLRQGWAFCWRSLMGAELISVGGTTMGFGLGALLAQDRAQANLPAVLATTLLILAIGMLVELMVFAPLAKRVARGRGAAGAGAR